MNSREEAKTKAEELLEKVDKCINGDINQYNAKEMVRLIIAEILQTNPTIKGNSEDLITTIIQTKSFYYLVEEELDKL